MVTAKKGGLAMKTNATLGQAAKILSLFEETPIDHVQALLASGLLADLRDANIATIERDSFRKFVGLKSLNPPLLEPLGTVIVSVTGRFVAREKFVRDTTSRKAPNISYVGNNFSDWLLSKIEEPKPETQLRYAKLLKYSVARSILAELGNSAETTLAEVYALMERQPNGKDGVLLVNGWANIFFVRDVNDELRAVRVFWGGGGWRVGADSVADPREWGGGDRVFSRNSCNP